MIKLTPEKMPYYENVGQTKVYTALITQTSTNPPTVEILKNTLGNIIWTRTGTGAYVGTLTGAFPETKTWVMINQEDWMSDTGKFAMHRNNNDDSVYIDTFNAAGVLTDEKLSNTSIEIRTYS